MESGILSLMALARNDYEAKWNLGMDINRINRLADLFCQCFQALRARDNVDKHNVLLLMRATLQIWF